MNHLPVAESIEWFIKDQAFSASYDLAPPPSPPLYRQQVVFFSQSSYVLPVGLTEGEVEGVGEEPNLKRQKAWFSINHSILSDLKAVYSIYVHLSPCISSHFLLESMLIRPKRVTWATIYFFRIIFFVAEMCCPRLFPFLVNFWEMCGFELQ